LDHLQFQLRSETKLSPKTINSTIDAVCTSIREAFRLGMITHNPAQNFRSLPEKSKEKGILTTAEMEAMFAQPFENEQIRLAISVAYSAGLRVGEILALSTEDITEDFEHKPVLWVRKSWSAVEGLKGTKTGNVRVVPISEEIKTDLLKLADQNPYKNGFIMWGTEADKPISPKSIEYGFYRHLAKIGIDDKERLRRNVSFHSFRHGFNSALRGSVPDATLRLATGHLDPEMTNRYDHLTDERLADIRKAQEEKVLLFKRA
jgi:integrase